VNIGFATVTTHQLVGEAVTHVILTDRQVHGTVKYGVLSVLRHNKYNQGLNLTETAKNKVV
jgi:hypothetical protein